MIDTDDCRWQQIVDLGSAGTSFQGIGRIHIHLDEFLNISFNFTQMEKLSPMSMLSHVHLPINILSNLLPVGGRHFSGG